ncbi:MAG: 50S ribosome-binding GTPase, partial [Lentimicrobiaceae bacterium]|nr:50S ribosome-binding GTPase [Lentimicrobiaceae bacterium]
MTLLDLETGKKGFITKVKGRGAFRKRIMEMGFLTGKEITVVKKAPLRDPVEYNIMGYNVSLRNSEAAFIEIISETESTQGKKQPSAESFSGEYVKNHLLQFDKVINVAFVGNPNSGKTTIFNYASGAKERVGNYSGVTVEAKDARFRLQDYTFNVTDLPGTYSISAYSPEELFVRDFISQNMPDVVVNVVDASNLERNLYLTTQLIDMDIKVVVALNMYDELTNSGNKLNHNYLGKLLGIPFVPTVGSRGKGIDDLLQKIIEVHEDREKTARHIHIHYGNVLENSIRNIQEQVKKPCNQPLIDTISSRFLALKLLEKDKQTQHIIENSTNNAGEILKIAEKERKRIVNDLNEEPETLITDAKYGFIAGALRETLQTSREAKVSRSEIIDIFITHKIWGIPIFIAFMWLTFYFTFRLGIYPQQWIEASVDYISGILQQYMQPGMLKDLFIQGII